MARDPNAPPAARAQAARTLLEVVGRLGTGRVQDSDAVPATELSRAEMLAELTRLRASP